MRNWLAACLMLALATPAVADPNPLIGTWRAVTIAPEPASQIFELNITFEPRRTIMWAPLVGEARVRCSDVEGPLMRAPFSTCTRGIFILTPGTYESAYYIIGRTDFRPQYARPTAGCGLVEGAPIRLVVDGDRLSVVGPERLPAACPPEGQPLATIQFVRMCGSAPCVRTFPKQAPRQPPSIPSQRPPASTLPTLPRQPPSIPEKRVPGIPQ
jgi:hypothetical protein